MAEEIELFKGSSTLIFASAFFLLNYQVFSEPKIGLLSVIQIGHFGSGILYKYVFFVCCNSYINESLTLLLYK